MKMVIWSVFVFLGACWTALVALGVQITAWLLGLAGSGEVAAAATSVGQWPVPAWAAPWIDPAWLQAVQVLWVDLLQWLGQASSSSEGLTGWIAPLLWTGWGLGMLCLLALAMCLHWLAGRLKKPGTFRGATAHGHP